MLFSFPLCLGKQQIFFQDYHKNISLGCAKVYMSTWISLLWIFISMYETNQVSIYVSNQLPFCGEFYLFVSLHYRGTVSYFSTTLSSVVQILDHLNKDLFTVNNDCVHQYFHIDDFYKGWEVPCGEINDFEQKNVFFLSMCDFFPSKTPSLKEL